MLELNQARAADFELVGRRQIALSGLLSSKPRIILQREPLISTRDGAVVGYVHVEVGRWGGEEREGHDITEIVESVFSQNFSGIFVQNSFLFAL